MNVIRNRQQRLLSDASVINYGIYEKNLPAIFHENYIFSIPKGFDSPDISTVNVFEKKCLVASILLGTYIELGKNLEWPNFREKGEIMWRLKSNVQKLKLEACQALYEEYLSIIEKYPVLKKDSSQRLEIVCPILMEHYKINVIVHQIVTKDIVVYKSPKVYDVTRPRVDLYQHREGSIAHIGLISYKNYGYIDNYGSTCLICQKNTTGHSNRHRCENISQPTCQLCYRVLNRNALCYKSSRDMYCHGNHDHNPVNCRKCGILCPNRKYSLVQ